jgi:hypothetical protein
VENRVYLSRGVQVAGATWRATMRIVARVGDLVQRIRDGQTQVGYLVTGRSGGWVTLCAVCIIHMKMRSVIFLIEPQNQCQRFFDLGLKTDSFSLVVCASKSPRRFLSLDLKTKRDLVCRLHHKTDGKGTV